MGHPKFAYSKQSMDSPSHCLNSRLLFQDPPPSLAHVQCIFAGVAVLPVNKTTIAPKNIVIPNTGLKYKGRFHRPYLCARATFFNSSLTSNLTTSVAWIHCYVIWEPEKIWTGNEAKGEEAIERETGLQTAARSWRKSPCQHSHGCTAPVSRKQYLQHYCGIRVASGPHSFTWE